MLLPTGLQNQDHALRGIFDLILGVCALMILKQSHWQGALN